MRSWRLYLIDVVFGGLFSGFIIFRPERRYKNELNSLMVCLLCH